MKTVLLHIGTMKTGNTSIHHALAGARSAGALGAVRYPLWQRDLHQSRMATLYCPDTLARVLPSLRDRFPAGERGFRRMLRDYRAFVFGELRRASGAILSSEAFAHLFDADMARALRRDLEEAGFRRFRILLYVRDPADYYLSAMSQNLRMSEPLPLVKDPASFRYDFLRIAGTWEEAFPSALSVRKYPPDGGRDVVTDFNAVVEECLGLGLPAVPVWRNASLSVEGMQILQDHRAARDDGAITPDAARLAVALVRSQQAVAQTRPRLKPEIAQQIRGNHAADAEVLRRRFGVDLGLAGIAAGNSAPRAEPWRVDEIVCTTDPAIMRQLLVAVAPAMAKRSLAYRIAAKVYRLLPRWLWPAGLRRVVQNGLRPEA